MSWLTDLKKGDTVYISLLGACIETTVSDVWVDNVCAGGIWFCGGFSQVGDNPAYLMKESDDSLYLILRKFGNVQVSFDSSDNTFTAWAADRVCIRPTYREALKALWCLLNNIPLDVDQGGL